ncbi:hypothetical protein HPB52_016299 [Rhipicephalus sanguineus]|uniref:CCHC-type domain-containing protein n=1 Tax=Rhipicephalus sanguineus TaxID=34632 RepID=A0A9D4T7Y3_RHISA|nr:hypothetical protein HPB52_016299 [Rhipicephalus sanguineus]
MEMQSSSAVPNYMRVAGHRVTCDHNGIQRVHRRCGESGHFRMNCTAPFCGRCSTYGHDGKGCSLPCRRCGDPHATVACTIRRLYSEAASKDFPPLQPVTPASDKREVPPTPAPGPAQDQNTQDAMPHPTPSASPVSPDLAGASADNDPVCVSRPLVITIERRAGTSLHSGSTERTDADNSVTSDASHAASSSSANSPTIEESPSTDDGTPVVKVVGGDNVDPAALPLPESSESSISLGVDSSIELSTGLDECDVEMLFPREVKRAHTTGTCSDGAQDSRSESQQPKKPRTSSRGPTCVE